MYFRIQSDPHWDSSQSTPIPIEHNLESFVGTLKSSGCMILGCSCFLWTLLQLGLEIWAILSNGWNWTYKTILERFSYPALKLLEFCINVWEWNLNCILYVTYILYTCKYTKTVLNIYIYINKLTQLSTQCEGWAGLHYTLPRHLPTFGVPNPTPGLSDGRMYKVGPITTYKLGSNNPYLWTPNPWNMKVLSPIHMDNYDH